MRERLDDEGITSCPATRRRGFNSLAIVRGAILAYANEDQLRLLKEMLPNKECLFRCTAYRIRMRDTDPHPGDVFAWWVRLYFGKGQFKVVFLWHALSTRDVKALKMFTKWMANHIALYRKDHGFWERRGHRHNNARINVFNMMLSYLSRQLDVWRLTRIYQYVREGWFHECPSFFMSAFKTL